MGLTEWDWIRLGIQTVSTVLLALFIMLKLGILRRKGDPNL